MSNSRKMKRSVRRHVSVLGAAALGTATIGGAALALPGIASASTPTTFTAALAPGATATNVYPGASGQAAGSVALGLSNTFSAGDTISIPITAPNSTATTTAGVVSYTATPTVTVSANTATETTHGDTAPTVTSSVITNPNDSNALKNAGVKDDLVLTFGNSNTGTPTDTYAITLSGIEYTVGASAGSASGPVAVDVSPSYSDGTPPSTLSTPPTVNNANVQNYTVTEPTTGVAERATNAIGTYTLKESTPGTLTVGTYTLTAAGGTLTGTATVAATGVTVAAVPTSGVCPTTGGTASATVTAASGTIKFCVVSASTTTTGPGSLTISGLTYTAGTSDGGQAVSLSNGATSWATTQPAITVTYTDRYAGYTADDTAAQTAESMGSDGAVILASDSEYQDALAASYLEHDSLATQDGSSSWNPLLLNPYDTANESNSAAVGAIRALNADGDDVSTVYIVGGTAAISQDVQNQLEKIQSGTLSSGAPRYLQVIRIAGVTAEQTASLVAQYTGTSGVGTIRSVPGAYGMYNSGASESAAGSSSGGRTAILADANEFQDALSAAPLSSDYSLPVLLNAGGQGLDPNAAAALTNLQIDQVIVVGGTAAVSTQAVNQIEDMNIPVLRVAGTTFDATSNLLAQFEVNDYTAPVPGAAAGSQLSDGLSVTPHFTGPAISVGTSRGDAYQDALSAANVLADSGLTPILLNSGTNTESAGVTNFLTTHGTPPAATFRVYTSSGDTTGISQSVGADFIFGGTLAQSPAVVQSELNNIAAG